MASVNTGSTGSPIDTVVVGTNNRQVLVVGSPTTDINLAEVSAAGALKVEPATNVGRTRFTLAVSTTTPTTAETVISASPIRAGVAGSGATSHAVTAGKRLRITSASVIVRTTTAAVPWVLLSVRSNPNGAATTSSPMVFYLGAGGTAATSGNTASMTISVEEGVEFTGTEQIAMCISGNVNTNVVQATLLGYEY